MICATTLIPRSATFAVVLLCTACAQIPPKAVVDFAEPQLPATAAARADAAVRRPNGSLFQQASYRPAFEDSRARLLGDLVTINLKEQLQATQDSGSKISRTSGINNKLTVAPPNSLLGTDLLNLNMTGTTSNTFDGNGESAANNSFESQITTTVIEVLPNGNLVVSGEKQIGLNQNVDVMRFTGTVDPRQLQAGNIIESTRVANVRVESRIRGAQGEAQTVGWLSRFFLSFNPF